MVSSVCAGYYSCFYYNYSSTVYTSLCIFPLVSLEQVNRTKTDDSKNNMCLRLVIQRTRPSRNIIHVTLPSVISFMDFLGESLALGKSLCPVLFRGPRRTIAFRSFWPVSVYHCRLQKPHKGGGDLVHRDELLLATVAHICIEGPGKCTAKMKNSEDYLPPSGM